MKNSPFQINHRYSLQIAAFILCLSSLLGIEVFADSVIPIAPRGAVGGGWSEAGPMGEYFVGPNVDGTAVFTRREVRVDFDWGKVLPVGGSPAEPYKSFPHDNFSARWTGKLIPGFSESYSFTVRSDSKPTLSLKDSETGKLIEVPLTINASKDYVSQSVALTVGHSVEVVLEYHHTTGDAKCSILWSSPSTPEEVIEPVIEQGLNLASFGGSCWADQVKCRRMATDSRWPDLTSKEPLDENGQPQVSKIMFIFNEGAAPLDAGNYLISFTGSAEVTFIHFPKTARFIVNGVEYEKLTAKGPGYDPVTNRTEALIKVEEGLGGHRFLLLANAFRDPAGQQPGVLNFHVMRPTAKGSETPSAADAISNPPMLRMASYFTCLRYLDIANGFGGCTGLWKDRTPPDFSTFSRGENKARNLLCGGENLEYLVIFANESGRDLYLTTPVNADDDYFRKLACLVRYGSDGVEPYTQPTANPKYPPLNSNLHLYFEVGNEIWNWGFPSSQDCRKLSESAVSNNTEEGQIINYDGKANYRRYHAVRTVKASNLFRELFGDKAMQTRIRPLLEFQYADAQETARGSFCFLDAYYNNGNGAHVNEPHPIRYYVWGGGGAAYYGVGNGEGDQTEVAFKDSDFEENRVGDGEKASPQTGAWKFTDGAGVYRNYSSVVSSYTPGKQIAQPEKVAVGVHFTTGEKPLWIYKLGRVYNSGNDKGARLWLLKASDHSVVAKAVTGPIQAYMTKIFGYYWAELPDKKPVQLEAKTDYLLLTQDLGMPSRIEGFDTAIKPGKSLTNVKSVKVKFTDPENPKDWDPDDYTENCCAGPVTMLYSEKPDLVVDLPQPPFGEQAAYINGKGEIEQQVDFPKAGPYALTLNSLAKGEEIFQFYCDDQNATPGSSSDIHGGAESFSMGGWGRNNGFKEEWGSAVFTVDKPGLHTLRFVGKARTSGTAFVVIDNVRIASADVIMQSGFGGGSALGQPVEKGWGTSQAKDSRFGITLGLPRVSYETGWSLGGDFYQKPIQNWCKLVDPRAEKINDQAIDIWKKTGGYLPVWGVYTYWPDEDAAHGQDYPIMKSFVKASQQLPPLPDNGATIPAVLTPNTCMEWGGKVLKDPGQFMGWTFISHETAVYKIKIETGVSGKFSIDVDGQSLGGIETCGAPVEYLIKVTKGIHGILIRSKEGAVDLQQITITPAEKAN